MKKIGVLGSAQAGQMGITFPYFELASMFGEVIIINPLSDSVNTEIDLLILVGGADLDPMDYGEKPSVKTNKPNPVREWFDKKMLPAYIENGTPMFGICLGLQSIVAHFGGKLNQHNSVFHPFSHDSRGELCHSMQMEEHAASDSRFPFLRKLKTVKIKINSLHHQSASVLPKVLKTHFKTSGWDKSPEIIVHESLPIVTVQFHPEEIHTGQAKELCVDYILALLK